jgi:hypothetical protein
MYFSYIVRPAACKRQEAQKGSLNAFNSNKTRRLNMSDKMKTMMARIEAKISEEFRKMK